MHWEFLCLDGGGADFGDRRAKVPVARGAGSPCRAAGIHYPPASLRCARKARIAPGLRPRASSPSEPTHNPGHKRRQARFLGAAVVILSAAEDREPMECRGFVWVLLARKLRSQLRM